MMADYKIDLTIFPSMLQELFAVIRKNVGVQDAVFNLLVVDPTVLNVPQGIVEPPRRSSDLPPVQVVNLV